MPITLSCPCGKKLKAPDTAAGKRVKCPGCGTILGVPKPAATPSLPPEKRPDNISARASGPAKLKRDKNVQPPIKLAPASPAKPPPVRPAPPEKLEERELDQDAARFLDPTKPKKKRKRKKRPAQAAPQAPSFRDHFYWLLLLALIPLGVSLLSQGKDDTRERVQKTILDAPEDVQQRIEQLSKDDKATPDDLFAALPDRRFQGAHLAHDSWMHWLYALLSAGGFLGLLLLVFPKGNTNTLSIVLVGLFTATAGIVMLLLFQALADWTQGVWARGRSILVIFFYIAKLIGYSYRSALDPNAGFLLSAFGFTVGVGLCEELCKALPLIVHYRGRHARFNWRAAGAWGLASGVGFGVAEGIMYSADFYNGVLGGDAYLVRFVSCVALHGVWSATVGLLLCKLQYLVQDNEWYESLTGLLLILAGPMILHGLYDTFLKKDMNVAALIVAVISFGLMAFALEFARRGNSE